MKLKNAFLLALTVATLAACASTTEYNTLETVPSVDLPRYTGTWFQIATIPTAFQGENVVAAIAQYVARDDGKIDVYNTGIYDAVDGRAKTFTAIAWVDDTNSNAKLKVKFNIFATGDYWVIDLADDYSYAVVGHPSRNYYWMLSRTPEIDDALYTTLIEKAAAAEYDTNRIIRSQPFPVDRVPKR